MIGLILRAVLLAAVLTAPAGASAEESRKAAFGREIQKFTQYNTMLIGKYNSDSDILMQLDELDALIDDYRAGIVDADSLRDGTRQQAAAIERDIRLLDADLDAIPPLPASSLPETKRLAKAVSAFRDHVAEMPESLRQRLILIEQSSAAALANDETRYQALLREQFTFLADQVDGETAVLRVQLESTDPKGFIVPLQHCVIHHNDAVSALMRSWADAEEIDLGAAMGVMAEHLEKADLTRRNGERKVDRQETMYKIRGNLLGHQAAEAKEMKSLFENMQQAHDLERQLVEATREIGEALAKSGSASANGEPAVSFESSWAEISALINRRIELTVERQMIAGRMGAAMQ